MEKNPQESPRIQSNRVEEWKDRWERIRMKGGRKMEGEEEEEREEGEEAADRPTKRAVRAQWRRTEIAAAPVIADWSMPIIPLADEKRKKSEGSLTDH